MAEKEPRDEYSNSTIPAKILPDSDVRPQMYAYDKPDTGVNPEIDSYYKVKTGVDQRDTQEHTGSGKNKYPNKFHKKPSKPQSREIYAAIDLGTNNCRLLIGLREYMDNYLITREHLLAQGR